MPKLGPYSKEIVLARPDMRSREGRLLKQMRQTLFDHFGGEAKVTPIQRILIERAAMLQLRCATRDERIVDGTFTEYDAKTFLAFNNSLTRTLARRGIGASADDGRAPTLADHLAALAAEVDEEEAAA